MKSIRRTTSVALIVGLGALATPASAGSTTSTPTSVSLSPEGPASLSFGVTEPGTVTVRVQTEASVVVSLRGPGGAEKAQSKGTGNVTVTTNARAEDVAAGKLWSVVVTESAKLTTTAQISVSAPGGLFTAAQIKELPEVAQAPKPPIKKLLVVPAKAATPSANDIAKQTALAIEKPGIKANIAAIGKAPVKVTENVTPPPTTTPPSTPQHRWAGFQSVVVTGRGTTQVCNGIAQCRISGGDTITMLSDGANGGFTGIAPEVHFIYLAGGAVTSTSDEKVTPIANGVGGFVVQVPMRVGKPVQDGMIMLGDQQSAVTSAPWGFHYSPRYITDFVVFDRTLYPSTQKLWQTQMATSLATGGVELSLVGAPIDEKKIAIVSYTSAAFFSADSFDIILPGLLLKNGWTVSDVIFSSGAVGGGYGYVSDKHVGTNNAEVKVKWGIGSTPASLRYEMQIQITGEDGTTYY